MRDLFLSEWRRLRKFTLSVAICHALALLFLSQVTDLLQRGYDDHAVMLGVYMLIGLTLALVQVGGYRRPSQWLWLIHRPLSPARIFTALALAALAILALAVFLPLLVFVVATDAFTTQVVDSRHYVALAHVLAFTMMAWLAGAHASVSRHKIMIAVLVVPLLLGLHLVSVWSLLLPVALCAAWLAWIALHAFRADRDAPITRPAVLFLTALPLQLAFFLLLFQLGKAGIAVEAMLRPSYPNKTVLATDVDADQQMRQQSQRFLIDGLAGSRDPRAAAWREQLPLLDVAEVVPDIERFPLRNQIGNLTRPRWDEQRRITWTFSHDHMRYRGRDPKTGADRGAWGVGGAGTPQAFAQVPLADMTRDTLYAIDETTQRQHVMVRLPAGEWFTGKPARALDRMFVLSNQRLRAYRPDRQATAFTPPALDWELALPGTAGRPVQVTIAEMLDGWLVSFYQFPSPEFAGFEWLTSPSQQVLYVDADGHATVVAQRNDLQGHNVTLTGAPAVPEASWWVSPLLYALGRAPDSVLDEGLTQPTPLAPLPAVRVFYPLAAALLVVSLLLGAWWLRGARTERRRFWLASCALLGLPAFLSLVCLEPRSRKA